jgi:hypothetical protein
MDALLKDVLFQAPGLAVAAFIVVKFLNYIKARNGSLEAIFQEHNEALRENSKVMGAVLQALKSEE